jgi:Transposase, Mutator family
LETVIAVAEKLPDISDLNRRLEIRWSGRYILDGVFFKYRGGCLVLLLLADAESLDLIDYLIAEGENYQSWKIFVQRVKPEIEANGKLEKFFVSDGKKGLHQALKELFPGVPRQLCISHKQRRIISIIPQIYGNNWDKLLGHLGHKAIGAKSKSEYFVYLSLLKEFTKPTIFNRIPETEQRKLKKVIGVLKFQRNELHAQFDHPELVGKDTTSNILEGINGFLKERLKLMRGLKKETHVPKIIKLLIYYYRFHPFVASGFKERNGKAPVELNQNMNREKIQQLMKCRRPYSWIINLLSGT